MGTILNGNIWFKPNDNLGIAVARNSLSKIDQQYLSLGGLGPSIGDGSLSYKPEETTEIFYNHGIGKYTTVTLDLQHIMNPAYNSTHSDVNIISFRLHLNF